VGQLMETKKAVLNFGRESFMTGIIWKPWADGG